jgi:hypothetical protein
MGQDLHWTYKVSNCPVLSGTEVSKTCDVIATVEKMLGKLRSLVTLTQMEEELVNGKMKLIN